MQAEVQGGSTSRSSPGRRKPSHKREDTIAHLFYAVRLPQTGASG